MADEIFYSGPNREYVPQDGANRESFDTLEAEPIKTGFADTDYLLKLLALIRAESRANIYIMEAELNQLVLKVKDDPKDDQLRSALTEEWPSTQGAVKDYVPYPYYKSLEAQNSASATYIRKRWEDAARDIGGPSSFDLVQPLYAIRDEAEVVIDFLARFVGNVDDSSEERIVELLQEWAAVALASVRTFGSIFSKGTTQVGFSTTELDTLGAEEASQYQAIFAVKVNEANVMLDQTFTSFNKSYVAHSEPFYSRVLGPALQFRLKASRKIYPGNTDIARSANIAAESLNMNLSLLITDLMRRNTTFTDKMNAIYDSVALRDRYRYYVMQLTAIGKPGLTTAIEVSPVPLNPDEWFDPILETATPDTYRPSHLKLVDTDDITTHPWALDRFGRNRIEEDVEVKPGVKVGGVDLANHKHDGSDGSQPIKGINIDGLRADTIDRDVQLDPPNELRLIKTQSSVSGRTVDAHIAWDGDKTHLFDVQITPVSDGIEDGFAKVYSGAYVPGVYSFNIQTYDGSYFYVTRAELFEEDDASVYLNKIVPGSDEVTIFNFSELIDFYTTELGLAPLPPETSPYIGIQDSEVSSEGDVYFAGPVVIGLSTGETGDLFSDAFSAKYDISTGEFVSIYRSPNTDLDFPTKAYVNLCLSPDKQTVVLQTLLIDPSVEGSDYETQIIVGQTDGTTLEPLGSPTSNGAVALFASDYSIDGNVYAISFDLVFGDESTMVLLRIDPETGEQEVLEGAASLPEVTSIPVIGLVALENEFLITSSFRIYSLKKDLSAIVDLTATLGFNEFGTGMPMGLCKDRYGRVYTTALPNNDIYRICGPNGTGTYQ